MPVVILAVAFVLAFLMVSTIKYTKFKGVKLLAGEGFMYLVWAVLVIMLVAAAPQIALFGLFAGYALSGVLMMMVGWVRRGARKSVPAERASGEAKDTE